MMIFYEQIKRIINRFKIFTQSRWLKMNKNPLRHI